ncbi:hypothetical protein D3C72_1047280 [compost metagenome]
MAYAVHVLPGAVDAQQLGAQQFAALAFDEFRAHDHVDGAGFVFQRDEDHALGGLGPLAHGDDAAGAGHALVGVAVQDLGWLEIAGGKLRAQQGDRVAVQRQPQAAVVGGHGLVFRRGRQLGGLGFHDGGVAQQVAALDAGGGLPTGLAAVAGKGAQRVAGGQGVQVVAVQRGAAGQVAGVGKRRLRASLFDAARGVFPHALDRAQAEPDGGAGVFGGG